MMSSLWKILARIGFRRERRWPSSSSSRQEGPGGFASLHHVNAETLNHFFRTFAPVFFLNTGRSGSAFLDSAFKHISSVQAYHEAFPTLMMFSNYAFHNRNETLILRRVFEAARVELMLDAFIQNKNFIETNHCLVFF